MDAHRFDDLWFGLAALAIVLLAIVGRWFIGELQRAHDEQLRERLAEIHRQHQARVQLAHDQARATLEALATIQAHATRTVQSRSLGLVLTVGVMLHTMRHGSPQLLQAFAEILDRIERP